MKKILSLAAAAALLFASCGTDKATGDTTEQQNEENLQEALIGDWLIGNIVVNDSLTVIPAEIPSEQAQTATFTPDSILSIQTNCNILNSSYTVSGDTLYVGETLSTMMACDNSVVEDVLKQMLPEVTTYAFANDTTLVINTANGGTIQLTKID